MIGKFVSDMMIKPGKAPVFDTPENYDLDYEDVTFKAKDDVELSGWLIKPKKKSQGVIIQSHFGIQCSRCGFTTKGKGLMAKTLWNKDIHFLNQAKYFVEAGYAVLMFDLRNHGNSGKGKASWIEWGQEEYKDVLAAVNFISTHPDHKNDNIGLLSICMGAASTTFAYGLEASLQKNKRVKALIAVQPLTYDYFVKAIGFPDFIIKAGNKYNKQKRNVNLTGDSFLPYAKDISVPTLVIQNKNDPMTNLDMVKQFYDGLTVEKEVLWLNIEKKRAAAYDWIGKNPKPILRWFDKYLK